MIKSFQKIFFFILFTSLCLQGAQPPQLQQVDLDSPNLSKENYLETVVCLRPYRQSGVRLETESLSDKLIIHNYGYGGFGLTLSWGGAQEVLALLDAELSKQPALAKEGAIAVLGAGVIGLTTAYDLLAKGYQVHLYAKDFFPHLTSNKAAGIWTPPTVFHRGTVQQRDLYKRLLETSKERFSKSLGDSPEFEGIRMLDAYRFEAKGTLVSPFLLDGGEPVVVHFSNGVTKNGKRASVLSLEGKTFLEDLEAKVKAQGALFSRKTFSSLEEILALKEKIIINCTSLGSRELFHDNEFEPSRGHLVYFKPQSTINYSLYQNVVHTAPYWINIYPWKDRLIVGGLSEMGNEDLTVDPKIVEALIKHAEDCLNGKT